MLNKHQLASLSRFLCSLRLLYCLLFLTNFLLFLCNEEFYPELSLEFYELELYEFELYDDEDLSLTPTTYVGLALLGLLLDLLLYLA